jgi:hypothetical protein
MARGANLRNAPVGNIVVQKNGKLYQVTDSRRKLIYNQIFTVASMGPHRSFLLRGGGKKKILGRFVGFKHLD